MPYKLKRVLLFIMCYALCVTITFMAWNFSSAIAMQQPSPFTWWWFLIALPITFIYDGFMSMIHVWWQNPEDQE